MGDISLPFLLLPETAVQYLAQHLSTRTLCCLRVALAGSNDDANMQTVRDILAPREINLDLEQAKLLLSRPHKALEQVTTLEVTVGRRHMWEQPVPESEDGLLLALLKHRRWPRLRSLTLLAGARASGASGGGDSGVRLGTLRGILEALPALMGHLHISCRVLADAAPHAPLDRVDLRLALGSGPAGQLRSLSWRCSRGAWLTGLGACSRLEALDLADVGDGLVSQLAEGGPARPAGAAAPAQLTLLDLLCVDGPMLTDVAPLAALRRLRHLSCAVLGEPPSGWVAAIAGMRELTHLAGYEAPIQQLPPLPALAELRLTVKGAAAGDLAHIAQQAPALRALHLLGTWRAHERAGMVVGAADAGAVLTGLTSLEAARVKVRLPGGAAAPFAAMFPALLALRLDYRRGRGAGPARGASAVLGSLRGMAALSSLRDDSRLRYSHADMEVLASLPRLQHLERHIDVAKGLQAPGPECAGLARLRGLTHLHATAASPVPLAGARAWLQAVSRLPALRRLSWDVDQVAGLDSAEDGQAWWRAVAAALPGVTRIDIADLASPAEGDAGCAAALAAAPSVARVHSLAVAFLEEAALAALRALEAEHAAKELCFSNVKLHSGARQQLGWRAQGAGGGGGFLDWF